MLCFAVPILGGAITAALTLPSPDRMEKCYVHHGTSPSRSVVATCYTMDRVKR
jgi:hypothetical protein